MQAQHAPPQLEGQGDLVDESRAVHVLLPAAVLAVTFLAYAGTLGFGFVFDDHVLIVANDSIRSWHYFPSYFTSHIWSFRYPHLLANYYRPFFLTWLRLNDALFGLHPWGWHLTSVLTHVGVTYLVYCLCFRLAEDRWAAAAGGLIFGLHPVHTEAVADITSIQEPLSTLFILGAILAFRRSRERGPRFWWLTASLLLTAAALFSKESGMILPILVGGYAWIYGGRSGREVVPGERAIHFSQRVRSALGESIPFWAVILIYVLLRIRVLTGFAHVITPLPLSMEILTIPSVLLFYLRLLVWPSGLSCYYDTPYVSTPGWNDFILPSAVLAMVGVGLALWYGRTRRSAPEEAKAIAFASLWLVITLLPVLNFRFLPEGEIAHDRYVYLPSVGIVILVAIALCQVTAIRATSFVKPAGALLPVLALSGVMGYATARQSLFWSDDLTLNYRAHKIAPHNVSATTSLGAAVAERGMDGTAMALYQQALAIRPHLWRANLNLAYLYYGHGNYPEAMHFFARACTDNPSDGDQFLYFGMALLHMGRISEAEKAVRSALVVRPRGKAYHLGLGMVLRAEGKLPEARQEIAAELAADPQNAQARILQQEVIRQIQTQGAKPSANQWSDTPPVEIK
ncbi:MAG TPA: tetratricopeptide repeat protein [Terriglobia bacterium]|nr:tetratricopeptide repeat protein [Terriglobia bacterium]